MELFGKPVSRGIVIGEVMRYDPFQPQLTESPIPVTSIPEALVHYEQAKTRAQAELNALEEKTRTEDPDKAKIMAAHRDILQDPAMDEDIRNLVNEQHVSPDAAIARTYDTYAAILGKSKHQIMRERSSDLLDVKGRLLRCWAGEPERDLSALPKPVIVVADDLYPSDTVSLDRTHVLGIITQVGGGTSHTAIIARSYEIPAVLGVAGATELLADGQTVVLDAVEGKILTDLSIEDIAAYRAKEGASDRRFAGGKDLSEYGARHPGRCPVGSPSQRGGSQPARALRCGPRRRVWFIPYGIPLPERRPSSQRGGAISGL